MAKYTVARKLQCGRLLPNGSNCKAPRMYGKDGCKHHNTQTGTKASESLFNQPAEKLTLPDSKLDTVQDVIEFLGRLINCFKNGGVEGKMADTLARLCKELIGAIKERDSNSPEAANKKRDEIMFLVAAAKGLSYDAAREVLLSRNFDILEAKTVDAQTVLIEASGEGGTGSQSDEVAEVKGSAD